MRTNTDLERFLHSAEGGAKVEHFLHLVNHDFYWIVLLLQSTSVVHFTRNETHFELIGTNLLATIFVRFLCVAPPWQLFAFALGASNSLRLVLRWIPPDARFVLSTRGTLFADGTVWGSSFLHFKWFCRSRLAAKLALQKEILIGLLSDSLFHLELHKLNRRKPSMLDDLFPNMIDRVPVWRINSSGQSDSNVVFDLVTFLLHPLTFC